MDLVTKRRYQGYCATPALWTSDAVFPIPQIELPSHPEQLESSAQFKSRRLGKLVEEFVFHQLQNRSAADWICDSLQIHREKITVGEIDALYYDHDTPFHLEIAYKFYLFDTFENHTDPLAFWIGPNRKDNLPLKLGKLRSKQFPLLHHPLTRPHLDRYNLDAKNIEQRLCFKGQLFLPYHNQRIDVSPLNHDCVAGFYLSYHELEALKTADFFIPAKLDWLIIPHQEVDWIDYKVAITRIKSNIDQHRSPLVWLKSSGGKLSRCFVVFW